MIKLAATLPLWLFAFECVAHPGHAGHAHASDSLGFGFWAVVAFLAALAAWRGK